MYLRSFRIKDVRSIDNFEMVFPRGHEAGWHVILGSNGSGKSSVVRSFALLMMGEKEAYASRQDFSRWIRDAASQAEIEAQIIADRRVDLTQGLGRSPGTHNRVQVNLHRNEELPGRQVEILYSGDRLQTSLWGTGTGWFSASFGPFRRFTGGDRIYDRLFLSNRRLAPHLTALGEDVALTEALGWLTSLHVQGLEDERSGKQSIAAITLNLVLAFLNESHFLPHDARIENVTNEQVLVKDGNGAVVSLDQLSDGYRSALSLTLELIRQMFELYGRDIMAHAMEKASGVVLAPGVVMIDEIDAHLHPSWQRDIGRWLTTHFPRVQFIVTTHSPIICRAVIDGDDKVRGTIWRLPTPGSGEKFQQITGDDFNNLAYGDILDAFGTELFGHDVSRSPSGKHKLMRLAELNCAALDHDLTDAENAERRMLRREVPSEAGTLGADTPA